MKDSLVRNQFGGSIGGPIRKDKTFGFGTIEFHRLREGSPLTAVSTTQQFINFVQSGQFRTFQESSPNGFCVVKLGDPCPGAFANSAHLGANFQALQAASPIPLATSNFSNVAGGLFTGADFFGGDPNLVYPVPVYGDVTVINRSFVNTSRFMGKVDHIMSQRNRFTGTFTLEDTDNGDTNGGGDTTIGPAFLSPGRSILAGITWVHDFSATVINEAKVSYLRHVRNFAQCPGTEGQPSVVTGIDPLTVGFGCSSSLPQFFTDNQFQYQNHLSFVHGSHSFRTGVEYRRIRNGSAFEATKNGFILPHGIEELLTDGFFGDEADLVSFGEPVVGGFTFAQASLNPQNGQLPEFYRGYRSNEWAAYFQDDWKFKRNLTFNLGLRWEYFGPPHNFRPGLDSNFYFGSGDTPVPNPTSNPFFPDDSSQAAKVARGGFQQRDNEIWQKDFNNFAPRVGFAWDVFGTQKLVVRGGGAISYDRIWNNLFENIRFNAPFFAFSTVGFFGGGAGVAAGPLSTPGLYGVPFTQANRNVFNDPVFNPVPSPRHMDENLVTPYVQQFNIGVQYEFAKDFLFETNYITTQGRNLTGLIDINTYDGRTRGGASRRINPNIGGDNFRTNAFSSIYHGAQFILRNRTWRGLQFNTHYTFAKAIDEMSDAFNSRAGGRPTDNMNIGLDRGRADFDIRHRFVAGFTYDLPFFKTNRWLGGWTVSGIVQMQSGVPFSVFHSGQDPNADGYLTDRAIFLGSNFGSVYTNNSSPADGFFNTDQFVGVNTRVGQLTQQFVAQGLTQTQASLAAVQATCGPGNGVVISGTQWWCNGTSGRNVFTGPAYNNVDFGVHKKFKITEGKSLQLQANAFNIFNHPNFGLPVNNITSSQFGRSIATVGDPRVIQLALRFDF